VANIQRTRGIILKTFPFRESSLIGSIFTEKFGKIKVLAKGARRPKSKFCGTLEPFMHNEFIFYKKEFKEVYTLSDAVVIDDFVVNRMSLMKLNASETICEFFEKTLPLEEVDRVVYEQILSFLKEIKICDENQIKPIIIRYLLKALKTVGVFPHLGNCVYCHKEMNDIRLGLSISAGGVVCEKHLDETVLILDRKSIDIMKQVYEDKLVVIDQKIQDELKKFLTAYLPHHLSGVVLNSLRFIK